VTNILVNNYRKVKLTNVNTKKYKKSRCPKEQQLFTNVSEVTLFR